MNYTLDKNSFLPTSGSIQLYTVTSSLLNLVDCTGIVKSVSRTVWKSLNLSRKVTSFCTKWDTLHCIFFIFNDTFSIWLQATLKLTLPIIFILFLSSNLRSWCSGPIAMVNKSTYKSESGLFLLVISSNFPILAKSNVRGIPYNSY